MITDIPTSVNNRKSNIVFKTDPVFSALILLYFFLMFGIQKFGDTLQ